MTRGDIVQLLDADPDLASLVPDDRRDDATRTLLVATVVLPMGEWDTRDAGDEERCFGFILLDGVVAREVAVADNISTELLGPGDFVRPWQGGAGDAALLPCDVRWTALTNTRLAVLDRRFALHAARHPELLGGVLHRLTERSQRLAINQAISQLTRVDRRLLALFWHLAERWGRISRDGVVVPLALSHRVLGQLVGARRPTVSSALGDLARRGELLRRPDGSWLLTGDPFEEPDPEATATVQTRRAVTVPSRPSRLPRPLAATPG